MFFTWQMQNVFAQRGARTHDPEIKNALPTELAGLVIHYVTKHLFFTNNFILFVEVNF
jgi:hypothetical protein